QLAQSHAIKTAIEAYRRAKPLCMGSLFWQFNDCWPCASWSAIDYYGRWKALMYELKHLYTDVMISLVLKNNHLKVFVISDIPNPLKFRVILKLMNFEGHMLYNKEIDYQTFASVSEMIFSIPLEKLNISNLENQVVFVAEIFNENKRLDRNLFYFVRPADLLLKHVSPEIEINESGNKTMIFLKSPVLLKNVYLENTLTEGFFSDNFFDLLPGETKLVIFQTNTNVSSDNRFIIRSLGTSIKLP
ncbi:MAG: glycoside hydrolase family 2 protein, partial [Candidatus Paceibacterota bacterium]